MQKKVEEKLFLQPFAFLVKIEKFNKKENKTNLEVL